MEIFFNGDPLVVDPGVSTYEQSARREWERSTSAHNTVSIDDLDQSEMWSVFRVGRLAHTQLVLVESRGDVQRAIATQNGYRRLLGRPVHKRDIELARDSLCIDDFVTGQGRHLISLRVTFAPGIPVVRRTSHSVRAGAMAMTMSLVDPTKDRVRLNASIGQMLIEQVEVADGFGKLRQTTSVTWSATLTLPVHVRTDLGAERESEWDFEVDA
jgi:hypothetical protein